MNWSDNMKEYLFDQIKQIDEEGDEFWDARELGKILDYKKWENFHKVIKSAMVACESSGYYICEHFPEVRKPLRGGNGNIQYVMSYNLSRYACYLIVQNADSRKELVALGQTYFAIQTRRMELFEIGYELLSEDEKRFYQRSLTRKGNYSLNQAAKNAGVINFDRFHNYGYKGLYNGETADDIAKRKNLRYREDILDNMCSDELIINLFRISQTEQKIKNDNIKGENNANMTHYEIGKNIREVIKKNSGTIPEEFPTPNKSLKELSKSNRIRY